MKRLSARELEELVEGEVQSDAINSKEPKRKKKKRNHIYNKESK